MDSEMWARLVLAAYALMAVVVIVWQASASKPSPVAWVLYAIARLHTRAYHHWRANCRCPFPEQGPALIIANHRSPVDPVYVWASHHLGRRTHPFRTISFMMAREYYEKPSMKWAFKALRSIPVERNGRDMRALKAALRVLKDGEMVAIFPEGRLNLDSLDTLLPGSPGVAWLALRAQVPVYPVFIHNIPRGDHMVAPFLLPNRMRLTYGDSIDLSGYSGRKLTRELLTEVTDELMQRLAELGGIEASGTHTEEDEVSLPIRPAVG